MKHEVESSMSSSIKKKKFTDEESGNKKKRTKLNGEQLPGSSLSAYSMKLLFWNKKHQNICRVDTTDFYKFCLTLHLL